ncbi:MAG: TadE/TadG family type IV pilus assembly protein [Lentisphaeria bacterium]|jgi:hypothetical protein
MNYDAGMKNVVTATLRAGHFCKRRLCNDRGVAALYTAVVCMLILASFSLIYDVARISEDKMQLQNAVDAAALEYATWQARGMNTVQNLNQEIYNLDSTVITMYMVSAVLTYAAQPLKAFAYVGAALEFFSAGLLYGGGYVHHVIGVGFLQSLRHFYAYGTNILAYIGANEVARLNGADPLFSTHVFSCSAGGSNFVEKNVNKLASLVDSGLSSMRVLCIPASVDTFMKLPLELEKGTGLPLNIFFPPDMNELVDLGVDISSEFEFSENYDRNNSTVSPSQGDEEDQGRLAEKQSELIKESYDTGIGDRFTGLPADVCDLLFDSIISTAFAMFMVPAVKMNTFTFFLKWEHFTWCDNYYRSVEKYRQAGKTSLPPVLVIGRKSSNVGLLSRYFLQAKATVPVTAYAVARCEGGNVVAYVDNFSCLRAADTNTKPRDSSHGVSASAVLVPFSTYSEAFHNEIEPDSEIREGDFLDFLNGILLH